MLTVSKRATRPRISFSPLGYRRARKKYDNGDPRELIAMMQEAAVDSQVAGCLVGRNAGYKRAFSITSFDDSDTDNARRDWIAGVLQRVMLRQLLEDIHDARKYIFKVIDFEWEVVDGRQVPVRYKAFEQKYFRRDKSSGRLGIDYGQELRTIPDTALVIEHDRDPIMLPVLRDYILKEFGLESWTAFLETFGEPFIIGTYPPGADQDFKDEVEAAVNKMASSSRGIAPDGTEFEVISSQRFTADQRNFIENIDRGISIALLGHANATQDSGGVNVGGYQTGYEVRFEIALDDMYWIEPWVNRLIQIIWDRNFADTRYPKFELDKTKPVDASTHTETVKVWYDMGLIIDPDEARKAGLIVSDDQDPLQKPDTPIARLLD